MTGNTHRRRRGNPDWGKSLVIPPPDTPTEFDLYVQKLKLRQQECVLSPGLRSWCELHKNHFYIPEWLLKEWGIEVDGYYAGG